MRRRFRLLSSIVFLFIVLLLIGLAVLVFGRTDETVEALGILTPTHYEKVRPQVDGIIEVVFVKEGDDVQKGDTLAIIQADELKLAVERSKRVLDRANTDLSQLREEYQNLVLSESFETQSAFASLHQAKRQTEIAKEKYERAKSLNEKELISSEEMDDRKLDYELSQSYYLVLKDRAELLQKRYLFQIQEKENEVELATREHEHSIEKLERSFVVAPLTGEILTPKVEELVGEKVSSGKVILEIGNLSEMNFVGELAEIDMPRVKIGQEVRIFINAFPHSKYKVFQGAVISISPKPKLTNQGIVFEVIVRVDDPWIEVDSTSLTLKPGLSGKAKIVLRHNVRLIELAFDLKL